MHVHWAPASACLCVTPEIQREQRWMRNVVFLRCRHQNRAYEEGFEDREPGAVTSAWWAGERFQDEGLELSLVQTLGARGSFRKESFPSWARAWAVPGRDPTPSVGSPNFTPQGACSVSVPSSGSLCFLSLSLDVKNVRAKYAFSTLDQNLHFTS